MFHRLATLAIASTALGLVPDAALACTMPKASIPEIELEVEFEDYDDVRNRLIYKVQIEIEVFPPTQTSQCQCGLGFGSTSFPVPASFAVIGAAVGVTNDNGKDVVFQAFSGFAGDGDVALALEELPGFNPGAVGFGFSTMVDPFTLPPLDPGDRLVLAFLIEFAPEDFAAVNGHPIQFAAGSNAPGHPLALFTNYQPILNLPPYRLSDCDVNFDLLCDVDDLDAILAVGPIAGGVASTDVTQILDLTGDDVIDMRDVNQWRVTAGLYNGLARPYRFGDANLDGLVNVRDLFAWLRNRFTSTLRWSDGNFDGNDVVDIRDLVIWLFTSRLPPVAN